MARKSPATNRRAEGSFELVRRGWELNPQGPGRESADYKSAGLHHMPNFSISKMLMPVVGFKPT